MNEHPKAPTEVVYKGGNTAVTYLFFIILAGIMLFFGLTGLLKEKQPLDNGFEKGFDSRTFYSGEPACGVDGEFLDYSHSINGITVLHEHYFVITNEDMDKAILVRAGKDFYKNFNEDYENIGNVEVNGLVKGLKTKVENELSSMVMEGQRSGIKIESQYFIDTLSTRINIIQVVIGAANIIIAICLAISSMQKRNAFDNGIRKAATIPGTVSVILMIACCVGFIYLMLICL